MSVTAQVCELSWSELNQLLLTSTDEKLLRSWLDVAVKARKLTRAMRIYGRISVVRREREVAEILAQFKEKKGQ